MANKKNTGEDSAPAPTKKYAVLQNLRHHGKGYKPGSTVELEDKHAAPLLKSKVVRPGSAKAPVDPTAVDSGEKSE